MTTPTSSTPTEKCGVCGHRHGEAICREHTGGPGYSACRCTGDDSVADRTPPERPCPRCGDSGTIIDRAKGEWDVCSCEAGSRVTAEIKRGLADIEAGRLHRWEDVRRDL